jgi:hypothetical protein
MNPKREARLQRELCAMEADFREQLLRALRMCEQGFWGLFRQNTGIYAERAFEESGGASLAQLGEEIDGIRRQLGVEEPFELYARLLRMSGHKDANYPGEPKLASAWLVELGSTTPSSNQK